MPSEYRLSCYLDCAGFENDAKIEHLVDPRHRASVRQKHLSILGSVVNCRQHSYQVHASSDNCGAIPCGIVEANAPMNQRTRAIFINQRDQTTGRSSVQIG